jgi:penicillin amidase
MKTVPLDSRDSFDLAVMQVQKLADLAGAIKLLKTIGVFLDARKYHDLPSNFTLPGLKAAVDLYTDEFGVPHIYAKNTHDLYMTFGYIQARDRIWQMEFLRLLSTGQLSSVLGPKTLTMDRVFRTLGLAWRAKNDIALLQKKYVQRIEAFAAGINEFLKTEQLPLEFLLLSHNPKPFTAQDVAACGRSIGWILGIGDQVEIVRQLQNETLNADVIEAIRALYPDYHPTAITEKHEFNPILEHGIDINNLLPPYTRAKGASNSWALSGKLTASGKPILASDPHLLQTTPGQWYLAHLVNEDPAEPINIIGATTGASPIIGIGHNNKIGWGITVSMVDTKDNFIEKMFHNGTYEYLGKAMTPRVREEIIEIKGQTPHVEKIIETVHGPIISNLSPFYNESLNARAAGEDFYYAIAFASTLTDVDHSAGFQGFFEMNEAQDWDEWVTGLSKLDYVSFNFVYSDLKGNIGYYLSGKVPRRADNMDGLSPMQGWSGEHDWRGYIPFDEHPWALNPKDNFVVSANNKIAPSTFKHYLGNLFANGVRAKRIRDQLIGKTGLTVNDTMTLQNDIVSQWGIEFTELLLKAVDESQLTNLEKQALQLLRDWNGLMNRDLVAPTLYQATRRTLSRSVIFSHVNANLHYIMYGVNLTPVSAQSEFIGHDSVRIVKLLQSPDLAIWKKFGGYKTAVTNAFKNTCRDLSEFFGTNVNSWTWGTVHRLSFVHTMAEVKPLDKIFEVGPFPMSGDEDTVAMCSVRYQTTWNDFSARGGAGYRQILDFNNFDESVWIAVPGQSGRISSPHHHDQIESWYTGKYNKMLYSKEKIVASLKHTKIMP